MDLHPLVVHFPIGLLVVYCLIEMMQVLPRCKAWDLMKTKTILLFVGVVGTYVSIQTGEEAAENMRESLTLELHEEFAEHTFTVFSVLAAIYVIWWLDEKGYIPPGLKTIADVVHYLFRYRIVALLALLGFVLLTATGALGGAMVHGPDPLAQFILDMAAE